MRSRPVGGATRGECRPQACPNAQGSCRAVDRPIVGSRSKAKSPVRGGAPKKSSEMRARPVGGAPPRRMQAAGLPSAQGSCRAEERPMVASHSKAKNFAPGSGLPQLSDQSHSAFVGAAPRGEFRPQACPARTNASSRSGFRLQQSSRLAGGHQVQKTCSGSVRTGATCCRPYAEAHTKLRNLLRSLVFYREPDHKTALFNCTRQAVCRKVERRGKCSPSRVEGTLQAQAMNAGVTKEKDFR